MKEDSKIVEAVFQLFENAKNLYSDSIENYWFNDSESCPACGREIDILHLGEKSAISLNAYAYRDMNALIAYFLCSRCAKEIVRKSKLSKTIYKNLEENLKIAYTNFIKQSAS